MAFPIFAKSCFGHNLAAFQYELQSCIHQICGSPGITAWTWFLTLKCSGYGNIPPFMVPKYPENTILTTTLV